MPGQGWIKLHRELCHDQLWLSEPFTRGQALVDLFLLANHADGFFRVRGLKIPVLRGQVGYSELSLSKRWQWSRSKVKRFILELQNEGQLRQQIYLKNSIITIVNYDSHQETEQQNTQENKSQKSNKETTKEHQTNINKNEKNEKNEKNNYTPEFELFYITYPRPEEKSRTFNNWLRCLKSYSIEQLMTACHNYKTAKTGTDIQYIKTSANFLGRDNFFIDYLEGSTNGKNQ